MKLNAMNKYYLKHYLRKFKEKAVDCYITNLMEFILDPESNNNAVKIEVQKMESTIFSRLNVADSIKDFIKKLSDQNFKIHHNMFNALFILAFCYERNLGVSRDTSISFQILEKLHSLGYSYATNALGECYETGQGLPPEEDNITDNRADRKGDHDRTQIKTQAKKIDREKALAYYQQAAKTGDTYLENAINGEVEGNEIASCHYGRFLLGSNDAKVIDEGLTLLSKSSLLGFEEANYELARYYNQKAKGLGYEQDELRVEYNNLYNKFFMQAYFAEYPPAQHERAMDCLKSGLYIDALKIMKTLAVDQDLSDAQWTMAQLFDGTTSGELDYISDDALHAEALFHRAAEQMPEIWVAMAPEVRAKDLSSVKAAEVLIKWYKNGTGVFQNEIFAQLLSQKLQGKKKETKRDEPVMSQRVRRRNTSRSNVTNSSTISSYNKPKIPSNEEARDTFEMENNFGCLAFCYHMGIGGSPDLDKALVNYEKALEKTQQSAYLWQIFLCYKSMVAIQQDDLAFSGFCNNINKYLQQFSDDLVENYQRKEIILGYVFSRGAPERFRDYLKALENYEAAKKRIYMCDYPQVLHNTCTDEGMKFMQRLEKASSNYAELACSRVEYLNNNITNDQIQSTLDKTFRFLGFRFTSNVTKLVTAYVGNENTLDVDSKKLELRAREIRAKYSCGV